MLRRLIKRIKKILRIHSPTDNWIMVPRLNKAEGMTALDGQDIGKALGEGIRNALEEVDNE